MTTSVPSSTLNPAVDSAWLSTDPFRRLSALMLVASERLLKLQREVHESVFAANTKPCYLPADLAETTALMDGWPRLIEENMQRYLDANRTYVDIFAQTQIEMALVLSDIVSADIRTHHAKQKSKHRAPADKRVSAKMIQFPDRRVAIAAAVSDFVAPAAIAGGEKPRTNGKRAA